MVEFERVDVYQTSPGVSIVHWSFKPTNEDLSGLVMEISRSYAPNDGFEKVGEAVYPQTYFRDVTLNVYDHWRDAYYRLSAVFQGRTLEFGPATVGSDFPPQAREMTRRVEVELRFSGMPMMVYLKRQGPRCSACWDEFLKKATDARCPKCFATGYEGGFYEPVLTLGNFLPEEKRDLPETTRRQDSQTALKMSNFPLVRPQDVIYLVNSRTRWRVVQVTPNRMHDCIVHQDPVVVAKLNPTDIEHDLPIPSGMQFAVQPHWEGDIRKPKDEVAHPDGEIEKLPLWR